MQLNNLVPLLLAKTRYFYDYSTPLEPLTETVPTEAYLPAISEKTRQRLLEIARYAERYLHGSSMNDSIHPFEESGRSILLKTHPDGRGCLDLISIERDLVSYFGEQCLELLELPITSGERSAWVKNQFRQNPSPMPTKHILFKLFIEHSAMHMLDNWRPDVYDRLPKEPWACQNPAAAHYGEHVVETVYKVADFKRTGVLGFSCNCGYTFLAETKEWDFRSQPKKIKVQQFGDVFISKARELRTAGHSISEIARRLNVRRNVIYSMLDEDYGTYQRPTPTLALEGRLRKQQEQKATTRSSAHKSSKKVDYAARDAEYVERFVQAAATIRLTTPPVRASRNHILEVSGVGYSQLVRRHFYPRSLAKLHELGETTESIRARRKQWHAQKIDKQLTNPD